MTETDDVFYEGDSMAIHVEEEAFSATPVGPLTTDDEAAALGQSHSITSRDDSPHDFDISEIYPDNIGGPAVIVGRSPAIHVYGAEAVLDPQDPIKSCDCENFGYPPEEEGSSGDWDPDWVFRVWNESWGSGGPAGEITHSTPTEADNAVWAGSLTGDVSGSTWLFAEVPTFAFQTQLSIVPGVLDFAYDCKTGGLDHIVGLVEREPFDPDAAIDTTMMWQFGACWVDFSVFPVKFVRFHFTQNIETSLPWQVFVQSRDISGVATSVAIADSPTTHIEPDTWYRVRVRLDRFASDGFPFKVKVWLRSASEPADWQAKTTNVFVSNLPARALQFYAQESTGPGVGITFPAPGPDITGTWHLASHTLADRYIEVISVNGVAFGAETSPNSPCPECEDPSNPPVHIPPFTPGYMPIFRRQIGDPTTTLDSFLCTLESAAMVLDWHTRGAVQVWGGQLIPYSGRSESSIIAGGGTNLNDAQRAWMNGWGQYLDIRSGQTWTQLIRALEEGRAVVAQGDYDQFASNERCQVNLVSNHAISIYPYRQGDFLLVGDPICFDFRGFRMSALQAYMEDFGAQVFGVTSPQKILFAVSRPWTP